MLTNIYRPLYGDSSRMGRVIGVFIRFWWVIFGGIVSFVYISPFLATWLILIALPFIPIIQLAQFISR